MRQESGGTKDTDRRRATAGAVRKRKGGEQWQNRGVVVARSSSIFLRRLRLWLGSTRLGLGRAHTRVRQRERQRTRERGRETEGESRERSGQQDEWLAKMFECDHELDLSHNLKKAVTQSSQLESESKSKLRKEPNIRAMLSSTEWSRMGQLHQVQLVLVPALGLRVSGPAATTSPAPS